MADGGIPNRNRADSALTIYRDAMRQYIAPILEREHGPNWIRSQVLNEQARERNERSYARRLQSLESGSPPHSLIDLADIPFVIDRNPNAFPTLDRADTARMHTIRDLRNEIHHPDAEGDCTREEADAVAGLCVLALERCGLPEAAETIRGLSSAPSTPAAPEADLQKERARREWDKERLSAKPDEELTALERQRLDDIAWEEEWERREQERERQEREGQERERRERERQEQERRERERRERERQEQERRERERRERERQEQERRERERRERERQEQERRERERRERERQEQERQERERRERERRERELKAQELRGRLSASRSHNLGLREDGTVVGWGVNMFGEAYALARKFVAVSAGWMNNLGLCEDGTVIGWGDNWFGECDAPAGKFVAVSAGVLHSLGLREDGTVVGWGANDDGQCDAPEGKFVAVSAGIWHSLGLREDGAVVGWGANDDGQCNVPLGLRIL